MDATTDLMEAINLAKSGNKAEAARILSNILKEQPENEAAWLWLASCLKTNQQKIYCLNQALALNPENQTTQKAIHRIKESDIKPKEETDQPTNPNTRPKSIIILQRSEVQQPVKKRSRWPLFLFLGLVVVLLLFFIFQPQNKPTVSLGYEGLYLSNLDTGPLNDRQAYYLLRFYPDGVVMGATIIGSTAPVGDFWSAFVYQNHFTQDYKEEFPVGQYQIGQDTPDGKIITFTLEYKYVGHPDYDKRIYTGYINEKETYLSECNVTGTNCTNRLYTKINQEPTTP
jgi:hypothetical protein